MNTSRPPLPSRLVVKKATAAKLLECSQRTVERLVQEGHLPLVRLGSGRSVRIPFNALEDFITNQLLAGELITQDK